MATVRIELPHHAYDIRIEPGGLQELGASVRALAPHGQCGLVADPVVRDLYGDSVEASLLEAGYGVVSAQAGAGG